MNNIIVTQGSVSGVGLEVFLKSLRYLGLSQISKLVLIVSQKNLEKHLRALRLNYQIEKSILRISPTHELKLVLLKVSSELSAFRSIEVSLELIQKNSVLFNLPMLKEDFPNSLAGHTEFFRKKFKKNLAMNFLSQSHKVLLLTDHIKLSNVPDSFDQDVFIKKIEISLDGHKKLGSKLNRVLFSGINPHNGEGGLLGNEDKNIFKLIKTLRQKHKSIDFLGPFAGDTLINNSSQNDLLAYYYHDQGLAPFKSLSSLMALQITFGLPFHRISVDHGTAPGLFLKNVANPTGVLYTLDYAFKNMVEK